MLMQARELVNGQTIVTPGVNGGKPTTIKDVHDDGPWVTNGQVSFADADRDARFALDRYKPVNVYHI